MRRPDAGEAVEEGGEDAAEAGDEEEIGESIQFHFDKDEVMAGAYGVTVHPHLSTVTYLGNAGGPTAILPITLRTMEAGDELEEEEEEEEEGAGESGSDGMKSVGVETLVLSFPRAGKHTIFDGRFLHGVPESLKVEKPTESAPRVTFLANIWLNHMPVGIGEFEQGTQVRAASGDTDAAKAIAESIVAAKRVAEAMSAPSVAPREQLLNQDWIDAQQEGTLLRDQCFQLRKEAAALLVPAIPNPAVVQCGGGGGSGGGGYETESMVAYRFVSDDPVRPTLVSGIGLVMDGSEETEGSYICGGEDEAEAEAEEEEEDDEGQEEAGEPGGLAAVKRRKMN